MSSFQSPFFELLKNRINLRQIPFSDRGSRLLVFRTDDYLFIRLAERWFKLDQQLSGYRRRPPILDDWRFTDGEGQPLPMSFTTYPHQVECQTPLGAFHITFVDNETLLISLPPGRCGLTFRANLDQCHTDRRGGTLRLTGDIRRNVAYTTNARLLQNGVATVDGPNGGQSKHLQLIFNSDGGKALLLNITPRLGFNRSVPQPEAALEAAARRWHAWFAAVPEVAEAYRRQYYYAWWIMRAGLISTRFYTTREAMTPSKIHYVGVWHWDAYFHALAYRHVEMNLAKDQLRILLDHQREDGMIPDAVHDEGTVTRLTFPVEADVTKPPLLAWAAWKLFEADGDREFLDEIYEPIVRWNSWWFEKNDLNANGLCEYQHPFSSGLDDSPLWDEGLPVESPDLNTYLCLQQESLAKIAAAIGEQADVPLWQARAQAMAERMVRLMWDPVAGLFWAARPGLNGQPDARVNVRTPFSLFPLLTGRLPDEIVSRLVNHLTDKRQFWTTYPLPTVACDDPKYDPLTMWRGPTWVNVNYLMAEGLERTGHQPLAAELRRRTLDLLSGRDDIYEYYHPETGANPPKAAAIFGWSSAIFIDLAIRATREAQPGAP